HIADKAGSAGKLVLVTKCARRCTSSGPEWMPERAESLCFGRTRRPGKGRTPRPGSQSPDGCRASTRPSTLHNWSTSRPYGISDDDLGPQNRLQAATDRGYADCE